MKECFVPIEVCKKLAAKGYDGKRNGKYVEKIPGTEREEWDDDEMMWYDVTDVKTTPRIHIYDALKWLREVKGIDILPQRGHIDLDSNGKATRYYNVNIYFERRFACTLDNDEQDYSTYEQAAIAGIEYVLDNLI